MAFLNQRSAETRRGILCGSPFFLRIIMMVLWLAVFVV